MDIRYLRTFKMIADTGSFSKSAKNLDYAQSTISAHIQLIEEEVGSPLFEKIGKSKYLTEAGKAFLPYAVDILHLYDKSIHIHDKEMPSGSCIIGATESLSVYRLPSIIYECKKRYPNVSVSLKIGDPEVLREYLHKGEIDMALLLELENNSPSNLHTLKLANEQMILIEPIKRFSEQKQTNHNSVLFTGKGCNYRKIFENFLSEEGIEIENIYELGSIEAIKQCTMNGLGISLLPLMTVKTEMKEGRLKATPWVSENNTISTFIAYHKNKWISPSIQAIIDTVKSTYKEDKLQ